MSMRGVGRDQSMKQRTQTQGPRSVRCSGCGEWEVSAAYRIPFLCETCKKERAQEKKA